MKTGNGQSRYRKQTLFHVVWSVPAKVFLTVTFSIWSILTDHDIFGSDVEQDWPYTVFAFFFFHLNSTYLFTVKRTLSRFATPRTTMIFGISILYCEGFFTRNVWPFCQAAKKKKEKKKKRKGKTKYKQCKLFILPLYMT